MNNPAYPPRINPADESLYQARLDGQWNAIVALRETLGIARRRAPTYEEVFAVADKLAHEYYGREHLLFRAEESKEARKYRQKAGLLSAQRRDGKEVSALEAIDLDIKNLEDLLNADQTQDRSLIQDDLIHLRNTRRELEEQEMIPREENEVILKDWSRGLDIPTFIASNDDYHDFALPGSRVLRLRLLHPGKAERVTGADLLYEHHEPGTKRIRLAAVQYKIWNGKGLTITQDIQNQLDRLASAFCYHSMCEELDGLVCKYRFPYCSAFLRPTDKLQSLDPKHSSSGYHIQICDIPQLSKGTLKGNKRLYKEDVKNHAVSFLIFEELFNKGQIGSRW